MQNWKSSRSCCSIAVLLFDAFSNHCLANAVEPLRAANTISREHLYRWQFLSLDGAAVTSSSGLPVQPEMSLSRHPGGDFLLVMPSYGARAAATPRCASALRAARRRFGTLVGLDMGSWLLARAGLLDGRRATIHWDELVQFAEAFPAVDVVEDRFVEDGDIMTCGGVTTAFEMVLGLIERQHGPMLRMEVASLFMHGETAAPIRARPSRTGGRKAEAAVALMRRNIETPLAIPDLCARLEVTQRALAETCRRHFGRDTRELYLTIRLREARRLIVQTGLSVEEVAGRAGYLNASALTRAFRREFGLTPSALREAQR